MSPKQGNEFYYLDSDGKKQDAKLHDPILDNPEAEELCTQQSIAHLRSQGFTEEELALLFDL